MCCLGRDTHSTGIQGDVLLWFAAQFYGLGPLSQQDSNHERLTIARSTAKQKSCSHYCTEFTLQQVAFWEHNPERPKFFDAIMSKASGHERNGKSVAASGCGNECERVAVQTGRVDAKTTTLCEHTKVFWDK